MSENTKIQKSAKEIDVFNRHSHNNKLKITLIAIISAVVVITAFYFFAKSLFTYTIIYYTDGGTVYGEELKPSTYKFLQKTKAPKNLKKEGYYIAGYYSDPEFKSRYDFGKSIWRSAEIYVDWQPGYAVQLFFAEGEDDVDRIDTDKTGIRESKLKMYYEQYVKPGSSYDLPLIYNDTEKNKHNGEQLLWYNDIACTGDPFATKTFKVDENIKIYGKWFETDPDQFQTSEDGTLTRYLGYCNNLILPDKVKRTKEITNFVDAYWDDSKVLDGSNYSIFNEVKDTLEIVYINKELEVIGAHTFRSCDNLKFVKFLGDNVTRIGKYAFSFCTSLKSIDIPALVEEIGERAFYRASMLNEVTGCTGVKVVGNSAFVNTDVQKLEFESVTTVGKLAFSGCYNLKYLIIKAQDVVSVNGVTNVSGNIDEDNNVLLSSTLCKIYVKDNLVGEYTATYPWSAYSSRIFGISTLN